MSNDPVFQCWIYEPFKFNYSSEQFLICTDLQCACLTSVCSTNALKAKETVSAPLLPRKPHQNSDTVCNEGREWSPGWQNPLKIQQEATCCPRRGRPLPQGEGLKIRLFQPYLVRAVLLMYHLRASQGADPKTEQLGEAAQGKRRASTGAGGRTPWLGRGSPQIKMDAVPLSNLRSGTACAGKRAATDRARSAAASGLLCSSGTGRQAAEPSWDLPGGGGGRITRTISQLYYRHKEKDLSGAGVTFWCFMKAVN